MNREETKKVLHILSTAYPKYFEKITTTGKMYQIDLYECMFYEYPVEIVIAALKSYIKVNEYPPSIAGLQKQIDLIMPAEHDNAVDLWNALAKVCKHGSRVTQEEFNALPEPIKTWCGDVAQIKELSQMDAATFNSVIRGQFLKTIPTITERKKVRAALPQSVTAALNDNIKQIGEFSNGRKN